MPTCSRHAGRFVRVCATAQKQNSSPVTSSRSANELVAMRIDCRTIVRRRARSRTSRLAHMGPTNERATYQMDMSRTDP